MPDAIASGFNSTIYNSLSLNLPLNFRLQALRIFMRQSYYPQPGLVAKPKTVI